MRWAKNADLRSRPTLPFPSLPKQVDVHGVTCHATRDGSSSGFSSSASPSLGSCFHHSARWASDLCFPHHITAGHMGGGVRGIRSSLLSLVSSSAESSSPHSHRTSSKNGAPSRPVQCFAFWVLGGPWLRTFQVIRKHLRSWSHRSRCCTPKMGGKDSLLLRSRPSPTAAFGLHVGTMRRPDRRRDLLHHPQRSPEMVDRTSGRLDASASIRPKTCATLGGGSPPQKRETKRGSQ